MLCKTLKSGELKLRRGPSSALGDLNRKWNRADEITGKQLDDGEIVANDKENGILVRKDEF